MTKEELRNIISEYKNYELEKKIENFEYQKKVNEINSNKNAFNNILTITKENINEKKKYDILINYVSNFAEYERAKHDFLKFNYKSSDDLINSNEYKQYFNDTIICESDKLFLDKKLKELNLEVTNFLQMEHFIKKCSYKYKSIPNNPQKERPIFVVRKTLLYSVILMLGLGLYSIFSLLIFKDSLVPLLLFMIFFVADSFYAMKDRYNPKKTRDFLNNTIANYYFLKQEILSLLYKKYIEPYYNNIFKKSDLDLEQITLNHNEKLNEIYKKYENLELPQGIRILYYNLDENYRDLFLNLGLNADNEKDFNDIYSKCLQEMRANEELLEKKKQTREMQNQTAILATQSEKIIKEEEKRTRELEEYNKQQLYMLEKNNELLSQANKEQEKYNKQQLELSKKQAEALKRQKEIAENYHNKNDY